MARNSTVNLPPGFLFNPTDEELVLHFLYRKAAAAATLSSSTSHPYNYNLIPDLHLHSYNPWELHGKALAGDNNQLYFFSKRTASRVSGNGYWTEMTDEDDEQQIIVTTKKFIGIKKRLVFYIGQAEDEAQVTTTGIKTNWIMHEFRLRSARHNGNCSSSSSGSSSRRRGSEKNEMSKWVLCRVFEQNHGEDDDRTELSCLDEVFLSLDDLDEISFPN